MPRMVVVDEFSASRDVIVRMLLRYGGLDAKPAGSIGEADQILQAAADSAAPCLVILPAAMAADDRMQILLRRQPRPKFLLTCVRPPRCPLYPDVQCAGMGCLEKPMDLTPNILIARVKTVLAVLADA